MIAPHSFATMKRRSDPFQGDAMQAKWFIAILVPSLLGGCALFNSMVDRAMDAAGGKIGEAVGNQIGTSAASDIKAQIYSPEMIQSSALSLFTTLYYFGGYTFATKAYAPGQYTEWELTNDSKTTIFERAFLEKEANGREWWKVSEAHQDGSDGMAFEALLTPVRRDGTQQIVRMRAMMPGQKSFNEVPLSQESSWRLRPAMRVSSESMEGATLGWEPVKTPAGLFKARHVRYGLGETHLDWWLCDEVPGGVVKYDLPRSQDGQAAVMQLVKFGTVSPSQF